ncbi:uracil-DNA glycosylase-like [Lynx rufus]|uniref:uracil-DNA glycosylase-like n=1 Tax=Lynx rufus TaxID=61384 RepID=UPI001F125A4E|nr:uracil-DNA glycosylase-like [Lynx rufus]
MGHGVGGSSCGRPGQPACPVQAPLAGQPLQEGPGQAGEPLHATLLATEPRTVGLRPEEQGCCPAQTRHAQHALVLVKSWKKHLSTEFEKPYFIKLMGSVAEKRKHYTTYPLPHQIFSWTQICDIRHVKVVILGQDQYHGPNQAHRLCFGVQRPVPPPPSLENIYKELSTDIDGFVHPAHRDLSGWARQGAVLLL